MRKIVVEAAQQTPVSRQHVEIVERKGSGHPDSLCDAVMENVSLALSKEYIKKFGEVLHHNADKGLLIAGDAHVAFGGGHVRVPMRFVIGDRATFHHGKQSIHADEIALKAAKEWMARNMRFADATYQSVLRPASAELVDIFQRKEVTSNDTSAAVGYYPLTETERLVLELESHLNSRTFKKQFPEVGEDIKVMALRRKTELSLTLAVAFVDRFIDDEKDYFRKKDDLVEAVRDFAWPGADIYINTLDRQERGINGTYLTVTGTSAEQGDCGQVGRGNRVNGLIPLNRPIGSEAAAGKNPVSHIGKIYNVLANVMAKKIHEKTSGVDELYVWMVNRIGDPIGAPMVSVQYAGEASEKDVRRAADDVINRELDNINRFTLDLAKGKYKVC